MIARYDALKNYIKLQNLAEELTDGEMDFFVNGGDFYSVYEEGAIVDDEVWPEES